MAATVAQLGTKQVRIREDLGCMLSVISWFDRVSTPDILDPLVRKAVEARFAALPPDVQQRAIDQIND